MQRIQQGRRRADFRRDARRRGSVLLLSAVMLVSVLAFVAFTVDVGYIALTKSQLQASADAAVLASTAELGAGLSSGPTMSPDQVSLEGREAAVIVAGENRAGDVTSVYADGMRDVRLGPVGYGKPPKKTQFKKGQSGNSEGRPKGVKDMETVVRQEAYSKINVKEGGKTYELTKVEALMKRMMAKGIQGDNKAASIALAPLS